MISESVLKEATERLVSRFHPDKIILFGSQARGDATEHSDVDLLVVCEYSGKVRHLIVEMYRALKGLGFAKDIFVMTKEDFELDRQVVGTIARPASLEGRVLYERN